MGGAESREKSSWKLPDFGGYARKWIGGETGQQAEGYINKAKFELEELEHEGFCKTFAEYNVQLLRPLKMVRLDHLVTESE